MKFKNKFEEQIFNIASKICDKNVTVEHNKNIRVEYAIFPEIIAFSGPPKKEIDIITANLLSNPKISLLISCKDFDGYKAKPEHVQEWCSVIHTMNKYSKETKYLGIVLSSSGFTSGCEPWVASYNIGLIPPLKGNNILFRPETILKMFERTLKALLKRLQFSFFDLFEQPEFYDFVYRLTSDFEGYEGTADSRYMIADNNWHSSFSEMIQIFMNKKIIDIISTNEMIGIICEDNLFFVLKKLKVMFGSDFKKIIGLKTDPVCKKNISLNNCTFDFLKSIVLNNKIKSAADFGTHFEFGLHNNINFGFIPPNGLHIIRTINPISENEL
ncbi:MAG TPA: hypothetical protein VIK14_03820 [Ignavibacteria bacterium]